jgi:hypothetical protein
LDLKRGDPGQTLQWATVNFDPCMSEQVLARAGHAKSHRRMAVAQQMADDERAAKARPTAERPHVGEAMGEPHLAKLALVEFRGPDWITVHLRRLEIEANAEHATQTGESDPPNQRLDDQQHRQRVQQRADLGGRQPRDLTKAATKPTS